MLKIAAVALGGALGAVSRYFVGGVAAKWLSVSFPWGTLGVNLLGAFLIGFLLKIGEHLFVTEAYRMFVLIGFLGAFTTFSTFCLESFRLIDSGNVKIALIYVAVSNICGIALVFLGFLLSRQVMKVFE